MKRKEIIWIHYYNGKEEIYIDGKKIDRSKYIIKYHNKDER